MRLLKSSRAICCAIWLFTFCTTATAETYSDNNNNNSSTSNPSQIDGQPKTPPVVRKMSGDEGEKFFYDYYSWDPMSLPSLSDIKRDFSDGILSPSEVSAQPALLRHTETDSTDTNGGCISRSARRALAMLLLLGRDFQCPSGTFSCSGIGQPDSCCENGATCVIVQDTGLGVVGCCPSGETCGRTVSSCGNGYTSCSSDLGGGCCIPGYNCVPGGCAFVSTVTVTQSTTTFVSSSTVSTAPTSLSSMLTTSSSSSSTSTSSSSSTEVSSTVSPVAPVRPTTGTQITSATTSTSTSSSVSSGVSVCPTGFYACSAVYEGGCCRTGRNCDTTSCPATSSTTLINTNGITVAVPTGSAATTVAQSSGSCAMGWFSCAASVGGGCCPSGYVCGSSCTASSAGTATATVIKEQAGAGARFTKGWCEVLAIVIIVCQVGFP